MYKNTAVNKKKKLILQYLLYYIAVIYLGVEDLKTRRKTKQPEPRTSTVRTLGVDWAAHGSTFVGWWAVHAHGRRPKDGLMVDGPLKDLVFLNIVIYLFF